MFFQYLCLGALLLAPVKAAVLGPNILQNPDFENPNPTDGYWQLYPSGAAGLGWVVFNNGSLEIQSSLVNNPAAGKQFAELDGDTNESGTKNTAIGQTFNAAATEMYYLSFAFAGRPNVGGNHSVIEVFWGNLSDPNFWSAPDLTLTADGTTGLIDWVNYGYYISGINGPMTVAFRAGGTPDGKGEYLDTVSVQAVVPEPATLMLTGGALLGLSLLRRRKVR